MSRSLRHLTEAQIREAEAEGKLRNLEGEGRPLPRREGEGFSDGAIAAGHRIMAEAGALAEEFRIRAEPHTVRAALREARSGRPTNRPPWPAWRNCRCDTRSPAMCEASS